MAHDHSSWSVEHIRDPHDHNADGWIIVDEYGDEVRGGGFWSSRIGAEHQLALMVAEEIDNYEGPDPWVDVATPFAANH